MHGATARPAWRVRAVAFATFGRSYQAASRRRASQNGTCAGLALPRDYLGTSAPSPWLLVDETLHLGHARVPDVARPRGCLCNLNPRRSPLSLIPSYLLQLSSTPIHTHFPIPLDCVDIVHYSLTNDDNDGDNSDEEHTKD
ncbi:hypothetical protein PIB30_036281 [Stylosanthes scabra]|uniref:Uncharacterized protein n=1 Tax=Stylosanthes scabra TaxID=79078 RepID=A0ABU6QCS9_9FABA|nr:hypothetical protein [Stylosanthes scabra]